MNHEWRDRLFRRPALLQEKGAVENANKLLRQDFPKGTDLSKSLS